MGAILLEIINNRVIQAAALSTTATMNAAVGLLVTDESLLTNGHSLCDRLLVDAGRAPGLG